MRFFPLLVLLGVIGLNSSQAHAQPAEPKGSLDAMVNWDNPWVLTSAKFMEIADALPKKKSERAYNTRSLSDGKVSYSIGHGFRGDSGGGKTNLFNGALQVDSITVLFEADKPVSIAFGVGVSSGTNARKPSSKDLAKLKTEVARVTGDTSPKPYDEDVGGGHVVVGQQWTHRNYKVRLYETRSFPLSGGAGTGLGVFHLLVLPLNAK